MSKRRSRKDNDDSEWDCHKDTIKQLYITENKLLEGTDGVVERMQNLYNFYKTYNYNPIHLYLRQAINLNLFQATTIPDSF
jgi:hypothetical protein